MSSASFGGFTCGGPAPSRRARRTSTRPDRRPGSVLAASVRSGLGCGNWEVVVLTFILYAACDAQHEHTSATTRSRLARTRKCTCTRSGRRVRAPASRGRRSSGEARIATQTTVDARYRTATGASRSGSSSARSRVWCRGNSEGTSYYAERRRGERRCDYHGEKLCNRCDHSSGIRRSARLRSAALSDLLRGGDSRALATATSVG